MPKLSGSSTLNPDGLIPPSKQWKFQWERFLRSKKRIDELKKENKKEQLDFYEIVDPIITLLQNCYHLRDWITVSKPKSTQKVNDLFKNNFELRCCRDELRCCRDVCNGFKHKKLTK